MEISQISTSVRDLWDFLWPPVLLLTILCAAATFVARTSTAYLFTVAKGRLSSIDIAAFRARLRIWGLSKILPIAIVFLLVFILYVSRVIIFGAGELLPPTVTYTPDPLIVRHMDPHDVACLWSVYGNVGLSQLPDIAERQGKFRPPEHQRYWSEETGVYVQGLNATKFVMAWLLVWSIVELVRAKHRFRTMLRLSTALLSVTMVGVVILGMYLYAVEQTIFDQTADIRSLLPQDGRCDRVRLSHYDEDRLENMAHERWWALRVEPFRYGEWIIKNLLRGGA